MQDSTYLFILAGYPGAGKSTLLKNAVENGLPVFGMEHNEIFQRVRAPQAFPEDGVQLSERLEKELWVHEVDIPELQEMKKLPSSLVLHLDMFHFFLLFRSVPFAEGLADDLVPYLSVTAKTLANSPVSERLYGHLLSSEFFDRFDHVLVNTLYAPWERTAMQWQEREKLLTRVRSLDSMAFLERTFFRDEAQGRAIHNSLYRAWLRSLWTLRPELSLITETVGNRVDIKRHLRETQGMETQAAT